MTLRLVQESHQAGENNWKWSIWLAGSDQELDEVQSVRYILHSTFRNPVRVVDDRGSSFRIDSSGWGEFRVFAHVQVPDEPVVVLSTWLHLFKPDRRRVFISAQSADAGLVATVADALKEQGLEVLGTVGGLTLGDTFEGNLTDAVYEADAVVAVITTSGPSSLWVAEELAQAQKAGIPVYVVLASDEVPMPESLSGSVPYLGDNRGDLDSLAMRIRGLVITP